MKYLRIVDGTDSLVNKAYVDDKVKEISQQRGPKGDKGDTGPKGEDGKSAYEIAKANGYIGSETQWLASLKGEKGDTGETEPQGPPGASQSFRVLTQAQYKSLSSKDPNTLYYIREDSV